MTGTRNPINAAYMLYGMTMETATCTRYLGVYISSHLSFGSHIDMITGTATKTFGFVTRNIKTKMSGVSEVSYPTLI